MLCGNQESLRVLMMVRAYQVNGHVKSKLDPLGLENRAAPPELDPKSYGFTDADMEREFTVGIDSMAGILGGNRPVQTLRSILSALEKAYCGTVGYEYMHIPDRDKCNWLREQIENQVRHIFWQHHQSLL